MYRRSTSLASANAADQALWRRLQSPIRANDDRPIPTSGGLSHGAPVPVEPLTARLRGSRPEKALRIQMLQQDGACLAETCHVAFPAKGRSNRTRGQAMAEAREISSNNSNTRSN